MRPGVDWTPLASPSPSIITGLHCNNGVGEAFPPRVPPPAKSAVGGQADGIAFRIEDRGEDPVGAVGGGWRDDLAAVSVNQAEGPGHVSDREPDHGPGIPGRKPALDPLADEPGRGEVRVVLAGL